jgi:hypothetical protein
LTKFYNLKTAPTFRLLPALVFEKPSSDSSTIMVNPKIPGLIPKLRNHLRVLPKCQLRGYDEIEAADQEREG